MVNTLIGIFFKYNFLNFYARYFWETSGELIGKTNAFSLNAESEQIITIPITL